MGRMSDLEIALREQAEETETELLEGIGYRFLKLAELKRGESGEEQTPDRLTNTYETDESLEAKDAYEKANPKPAEAPQPTLEEVRKVLAELSRDGHTDEVRGLINSYGAKKLSEVDPKDYRDLLEEAGAIGHGG